ncbi:hypothetical protein V8G54_028877 [Vigna mungo]|uniref:Uncharacterized protein n=1 Tax=Vigna mungo TaxID=3915 RepID=A0AAQ3MTE3_VIGMU
MKKNVVDEEKEKRAHEENTVEGDQARQVRVDAVEEGLVGELLFGEAACSGWKVSGAEEREEDEEGSFIMRSAPIGTEAAISTFSTDVFRSTSLNRSSFPKSFIFGTASSAYQCEGAANVGGRGPSIWDTYTHNYPGFFISLPIHSFEIEPSNSMLEPFVTIFHWDLPQALEDEYDGFLSPDIVNDFQDYAELCFKEFGDRVKHWITLNEPWTFSKYGYADGISPPGRCSTWQNLSCTDGDSAIEPYIVTHNQLLAHAAAVNVYKTKYQVSQKGIIGISLACHWIVPLYDTELDQFASQRALDFMFGWFMEPLTIGEYPKSMQSLVGSRLPKFSDNEIKLLRGSFDFIGLNYYTSYYATDAPELSEARPSYLTDSLVILTSERNGIPIGEKVSL